MQFVTSTSLTTINAMSYVSGFSMIIFAVLGIVSVWLPTNVCKTIFSWVVD